MIIVIQTNHCVINESEQSIVTIWVYASQGNLWGSVVDSIAGVFSETRPNPIKLAAWVVECDAYGGQSLRNLVACGQLRNFSGAQELGSLVVASPWRGRGLGTLLTQHLINTATQPLYLECLGERLAQFYSRFGFVPISFEDLPEFPSTRGKSSLKGKFRFSQLAKRLFRVPVVFMEHQGNS